MHGPFEDIAPQIFSFNLIFVLTGTLAREPFSLDWNNGTSSTLTVVSSAKI